MLHSRSMQSFLRTLIFLAAGVVAAALPARVRADEFTDKVNDFYKPIQADKRSDTILLPLLAKMQPVPAPADDPMVAAMIGPKSASWSKLQEWALAQPQRDLIEAVKKVTSEDNPRRAFAFGQPYGAAAADPDMVIARMYTELGDPPTLAAAEHLYLPAMTRLFCLLHVEATRLQSDGKPADAIDMMVRCLQLGRQLADREFLKEKSEGMAQMYLALMRLRDIAYVDSRQATPKLTAEVCRETIKRLADGRACLAINQVLMPRGDQIGCEQLISRVFQRNGGPNAETFAPAVARIGARGRPLRLFSETAKWDALRPLQGNDLAYREMLGNVFNDWSRRWELVDRFDPILKLPTDYRKMDKTRFAVLDMIIGDVDLLFGLRRRIETEVVGTRMGLGMQGFFLQQRSLPRDITAVRPTFMTKVDIDPWDQTKANNLEFFVPMRDRPAGPNEAPKPHEIDIFPDLPFPTKLGSFLVRLRDDTFVMYSVGPDGAKNGGRRATGMVEDEKGDYLLWPPVMSLVRQNLEENGKLK